MPGTLVIIVRLQPVELLNDLNGFLRALGALLHTNLLVKRDKNNNPMLFPYYGDEDQRQYNQKSRNKRELELEVIGYDGILSAFSPFHNFKCFIG